MADINLIRVEMKKMPRRNEYYIWVKLGGAWMAIGIGLGENCTN